MANCDSCGNRTGWNIKVKDSQGRHRIELCKSCCICEGCNHPRLPSELQDVPCYDARGDRDDELHLWCEQCRKGKA